MLRGVSNYGKCHRCGSWVPKGDSECPHCGAGQGVLAQALGLLKGSAGPSKPRSGHLCVVCDRLMGADDTACPYCGARQTLVQKGLRSLRGVQAGGMDATSSILVFMGLLFVLPMVARSGADGFSVSDYLSGDGVTGALMGSLFGPLVERGQIWRFVTASYLHFGAMHILFNGLALHQLGRGLEKLYGAGWYVFFFVLTGIAAFVASYYGHSGVVNSAGASGPIFGILGLGLVFTFRHRLTNERLFKTLLMWTGLTFLLGGVLPMDNWAHGGGLVAGLAIGWFLPPELLTRGRQMNRLGAKLGAAAVAVVALAFLMVFWSADETRTLLTMMR